eukprot:TRINITY_DN23520_c0_g1_i1.p1 TRINITY_DN23520_c0_g1~~TRINITY_DN23520_c0_g1_i1.p1  ORF type:complete len:1437 (+),score=303.86 TRINITY_DN23520_c0_g1_i1:268-4311(+)
MASASASGSASAGSQSSGSSAGGGMCEGAHYAANIDICDEFHEQVRATFIFSVTVSSAILGLLFFFLGRFKATSYVSYVPTSVMEAFLSCVGYKVFNYALKFCNYDPKQFIPAACIGVTMYFLKSMHIGNPAIVIPMALLVPLGSFYIIIYFIMGMDVEQARADELMFPWIENVEFWRLWSDGIANYSKINILAWTKTWPDLAIMVFVVLLDCILKISSTESKLPVSIEKDYEIQLAGAGNLASVLCCSTVGYMQLKFNVINYGVMGNVTDRRAGIIYAIMCGVCFFFEIEHFNYLPRIFMGMLLFFAGAGFVVENLWGSQKFLSLREWGHIVVILAVFVMTGELLIAVIVGGLLTGLDFIICYSKVSCVAGKPLRGGQIAMIKQVDPLLQKSIQHLANHWMLIIRLKGFVFFASAAHLVELVKREVGDQSDCPRYRRLQFVVFDCEQLDGMDASAAKSLKKLKQELNNKGIEVLWSGVDIPLQANMLARSIINKTSECYVDIQHAANYIHTFALVYRIEVQQRLLSLHPSFRGYHKFLQTKRAYEPFADFLTLDITRYGSPWRYCSRRSMMARETVLYRRSCRHPDIYLIHSGTVGLFEEDPTTAGPDANINPVKIVGKGWFLNCELLSMNATRRHAVAHEDGELLVWTPQQWARMARERPWMARAFVSAIMRQQARGMEMMEMEVVNAAALADDQVDDGSHSTVRMRRTSRSAQLSASLLSVNPTRSSTSASPTNKGRISRILVEAKMNPQYGPAVGEREIANSAAIGRTLAAVGSAQVLHCLNFFKPPQENAPAVLPRLPEGIKQNLHLAFSSYAVEAKDGNRYIEKDNVQDAFLLAGVLDAVLSANDLPEKLDEEEFFALGHCVAMMPLYRPQVERVKEIFDRYSRDDGSFTICELSKVFNEVLDSELPIEELEATVVAWGVEDTETISFSDFLAAFSRIVRIHDQGHSLLHGFYKVIAKEKIAATDFLLADCVADTSDNDLTVEEVRELFWVLDCNRHFGVGDSDGSCLSLRDFAVGVMTNLDAPDKDLPPELAPADTGTAVRSFADADSAGLPVFVGCCGQSNFEALVASAFDGGYTPEHNPVYDSMLKLVMRAQDAAKMVHPTSLHHRSMGKSADEDHVRSSATSTSLMDVVRHHVTLEETKKCGMVHRLSSVLGSLRGVSGPPLKQRLYYLLEVPTSSQEARHLNYYMSVMIFLSVAVMFIQPLVSPTGVLDEELHLQVWFGIEAFFTSVFTLEYATRLWVSDAIPGTSKRPRLTFARTPSNVCDLIALAPFYMELILSQSKNGLELLRGARFTKIIRFMKVTRVLKMSRLANHGLTLAAPIAAILTVIWCIYLLSFED